MINSTFNIIGIDEAGRGPVAGPVAIAAVRLKPQANSWLKTLKRRLRDSKQLTVTDREHWFRWLWQARTAGQLDFTVALVNEKIIDNWGISRAVKIGISRCLSRLVADPTGELIQLDGSLKAPNRFLYQQTIIRGDETVPIIALASIAAKVTRDRKMTRLAHRWPQYGFAEHKGYGTKAHLAQIRRFGLCPLHRHSFLSRLK